MFEESYIETLNAARTILALIENAAGDHRRDAPEDWSEADAWDYGRLAEAASSAGDAIFNVLNTMSAYNVQKLSEEQLHNRKPEPSATEKIPADTRSISDWAKAEGMR